MILIKLILLIIVAIAFINIALMNRYKILNKVVIFIFFLVAAYFIVFPKQSDLVAQALDIKSGVNLVVYLTVSILFLFVVSLYAKVKRQDRVMTKIVRKRALDSYVNNS